MLGHGWDERDWPERRAPTMAELDRASYGGSVYLSRVDVHSAVASTALRRLISALRAGDQTTALEIGDIAVTFPDDHSAVVTFTTPFPCALSKGVIQGCCRKYGERALIEHRTGGCVDDGGRSCAYYVTW